MIYWIERMTLFETHRHIEHIVFLVFYLKKLCVLCVYVFQIKIKSCVGTIELHKSCHLPFFLAS